LEPRENTVKSRQLVREPTGSGIMLRNVEEERLAK
jgi:hypothetical protein